MVSDRGEVPDRALALQRSTRPKAGDAQRHAYRIPEFCSAYGISRSQAYIEIAARRLKIRKVGRRTLVATEDAQDWFAACAVEPKAA
jgi:hypothetical protein